jgi:hypothetical protein
VVEGDHLVVRQPGRHLGADLAAGPGHHDAQGTPAHHAGQQTGWAGPPAGAGAEEDEAPLAVVVVGAAVVEVDGGAAASLALPGGGVTPFQSPPVTRTTSAPRTEESETSFPTPPR